MNKCCLTSAGLNHFVLHCCPVVTKYVCLQQYYLTILKHLVSYVFLFFLLKTFCQLKIKNSSTNIDPTLSQTNRNSLINTARISYACFWL